MSDEIRELTPDEQVEISNKVVEISIIDKYFEKFRAIALEKKVWSIALSMTLFPDHKNEIPVAYLSHGHSSGIVQSALQGVESTMRDFPAHRSQLISVLKNMIEQYESSDAAQNAN